MDRQPDLVYSASGMFTVFFANTLAGEDAWRSIAAQNEGTGKILTIHLQSTLRQLRAARYSVHKSKPVAIDTNGLLAALAA